MKPGEKCDSKGSRLRGGRGGGNIARKGVLIGGEETSWCSREGGGERGPVAQNEHYPFFKGPKDIG